MPKTKTLRDFEGLQVARTSIALTNAGDGLSEAMKVEPAEYHVGDKAFLVIEAECTKVTFLPCDRNEPGHDQNRLHTFRAGTATIADGELIADLVAAQAEKNMRAREEEAGIQRLPVGDDSDLTIRVRTWLSSLKKSELVELCENYGVEFAPKDTALDLINLLALHADEIRAEIGD